MRLGTLVGILGLSASLLGASHTEAQAARARQLYAEGQRLFDANRFLEAEASFRAAYQAADPGPARAVVLRAIAAAQQRQGNESGEAETLQLYLRESPSAADRAQVEARLQQIGNRPGTVAITSTPPGAQIIVDGQPSGQTTPADVSMMPGEHTVELQLDGHAPMTQRFNVASGARMRLDVPLTATGGGGAISDPFGDDGGDGQVGGGGGGGGGGAGASADPSIGVWIMAGVAAAALVAGTVFGFLALSEQSNFENMPAHDIADRGTTYAIVADISFGVAAAAAITAVVLYIVERSGGGSSGSARLDDDLRLDLAPWADPRGAGGVSANLRF